MVLGSTERPLSVPAARGVIDGTFTFPVAKEGGGVADVRCKVCNKRAKFHLSLVPEQYRGRPRVVKYLSRPNSMPHHALLEEVRSRNRYNSQGEEIDALEQGFVKASLMNSSPTKVVVPGVRPEAKPFSRA